MNLPLNKQKLLEWNASALREMGERVMANESAKELRYKFVECIDCKREIDPFDKNAFVISGDDWAHKDCPRYDEFCKSDDVYGQMNFK